MDAVVEPIVEEPKVDKKPEWDKERQRADQAEANLRKEQAKSAEVNLKSQQLEQTVSDLKGKMEQIEAVKGLDLTQLDPDSADIPEVVKEQIKIAKALETATKKLTELEQKASKYESDAQVTRQEREKEKSIERIMKPLDKKYGPQFRNEARKLAEEEVETRGYAPEDALEARDMLEKHYASLKQAETKSKTVIPSDNGRGGSKVSFGDNITPGKFSDVVSQIRKGGMAALKQQ